MNKLPVLICVAALLPALAGCGSQKGNVSGADSYQSEAANAGKEVADAPKLSGFVRDNAQWTDLTVSGSLSVSTNAGSLNSSMQMRMVRNQSISISIRPFLGIEMGKLLITADSITVVDKYHRAYLQEALPKAVGQFATLSDLQDVLLARVFVPGEGSLYAGNRKKMEVVPSGDGSWSIVPRKQNDAYSINFAISPDGYRIKSFNVAVPSASGSITTFSVAYSRYTATVHGDVAEALTAAIPVGTQKATLSFDYRSLKWDTGVTDNISIPSGAQRLSIDNILKMISQQQF